MKQWKMNEPSLLFKYVYGYDFDLNNVYDLVSKWSQDHSTSINIWNQKYVDFPPKKSRSRHSIKLVLYD